MASKKFWLGELAMITEKLIFDRTAQDIEQKTPKGYYNVEDIKRINSYIEYLATKLNLTFEIITPNLGEALTIARIQSIIDNVNALRKKWYVAEDTPATPIATNWNYNQANDLEKVLQALYDFMVSVKNDKLYSGTFKAGSHIKFRAMPASSAITLVSNDGYTLTSADSYILVTEA